MRLNAIRPMLWTRQLQETVEFYTKNLGFICAELNLDWGWASLYRDDVEIMLALPNEHIPFERPAFTGSFYIDTQKVDELWEVLKDKVKICYPIENFDHGMREFAIYDNNGYIIQFGEEIQV